MVSLWRRDGQIPRFAGDSPTLTGAVSGMEMASRNIGDITPRRALMKITAIETFLMNAAPAEVGGWNARNWLFVRVRTDSGIYGVGESSGWPRVVETAIQDLAPIVVGEDPFAIERVWHKMLCSIMGHGMTGIVGSGAMTGIEMAL
jgi:L-alanine-DL-glutamate epimerase-like enolase superfamily enzyme